MDGFLGSAAARVSSRQPATKVNPVVGEAAGLGLKVASVSKAFGGVRAVNDVSLEAGPGSITSLIGPNGAGKTTLFNVMSGLVPPDRGQVWFGETEITNERPHRVARLGLIRSFQNIRMFKDLTVRESLLVAARGRGRIRRQDQAPERRTRNPLLNYRTALEAAHQQVTRVASLVGLETKLDNEASSLSLLDQRMVEIGRALCAGPRMILLDEPIAGATPAEARHIVDVLRRYVNSTGVGVLLIEHTMSAVMAVSDSIFVLHGGRLIGAGTPAEIKANSLVRDVYLGR